MYRLDSESVHFDEKLVYTFLASKRPLFSRLSIILQVSMDILQRLDYSGKSVGCVQTDSEEKLKSNRHDRLCCHSSKEKKGQMNSGLVLCFAFTCEGIVPLSIFAVWPLFGEKVVLLLSVVALSDQFGTNATENNRKTPLFCRNTYLSVLKSGSQGRSQRVGDRWCF